ncbi:MAG: DUF6580 family putative transport protein [Cytophagales bacterium]
MNRIFGQENSVARFSVLVLMVVIAGIYRLLPHPWNLAPFGAMALFGGAYFGSIIAAIFVPLVSLWISDLVLNNVIFSQYFPEFTLFYNGFGWQYGSFVAISCIGLLIKNNVKPVNVLFASVGGSFLFFFVSNFGVWATGNMYPPSSAGLMACYTAGLPFLQNTLVGDLVFNIALFGVFEFLQTRYSGLKLVKSIAAEG